MTISGSGRAALVQLAVVMAALACSSCFFDSRWVDMKVSQAAAVQQATPSALAATPGTAATATGAARTEIRVLKLRARATPHYAAEVVRWREQLATLLDDANRVLIPTLAIRLDLVGTELWTPSSSEDDIDKLADELVALDPGQDVHWVVGLVGSVLRVERSFHVLGAGRMMGKHLVMRAMNDAKESDAIQRGMSYLDEAERWKLYKARKQHKIGTVFLHELGHTLGVPHQPDATTIMHASYDTEVEGYSEEAVKFMRISLDHRLQPEPRAEQAFTQALIEHLQRTSESWVPSERDAILTQLRAAPKPSAPPAAAPPKEAAPAEKPVNGLSEADQAEYAQAVQEQRAGRATEAWSKVKPLFTKYPNVYEVQDLRCQLAMKIGGPWQQTQAHCERLMQLTNEMLKGARPK
jgi:Matrixin